MQKYNALPLSHSSHLLASLETQAAGMLKKSEL